MLARAKCIACRASFTIYPAGHYPGRQFQLDAVAVVVAAIALGAEHFASAAARVAASTTSARRWTTWIAGLAPPAVLLAVAQKLDPDAPVGAGVSAMDARSPLRARAYFVLAALEHLAAALGRVGVSMFSRTALGRVLDWQHRVHGDVVRLVRDPCSLSPAMAIGTKAGVM